MCAGELVVASGRARAFLCVGALAVLALTAADSGGKRAESEFSEFGELSEFMSPMPFVLGSRYGRSQPRVISPRNDRFFMSSRYGKRSELPALPAPRLLCTPLGVRALYRCAPAPGSTPTLTPPTVFPNHHYTNNRRSEEDRDIGEDE